MPVGSRKFTFEIDYRDTAEAQLDLRVNWFNDNKVKINGPFLITTVTLPAGQTKVVAEVELPASTSPRWLPSIAVLAGSGEAAISSLKVYETPAKPNPVTVWDGTKEVPVAVTVWDGAREVPASIEFQA
uniref:Periplasmic lypoprotein n=1 Tax=Myoviridae sp. cte0t5 TaxID=2823549 RepID=A0A8S5LH96_9CAUD|nr:MAG TPA: periplasmic lypoprotein [Myoviridae sp. cte0t5]